MIGLVIQVAQIMSALRCNSDTHDVPTTLVFLQADGVSMSGSLLCWKHFSTCAEHSNSEGIQFIDVSSFVSGAVQVGLGSWLSTGGLHEFMDSCVL